MKTRIYSILTALALSFVAIIGLSSPASAIGDGENSRIVNLSAHTITGAFVYNAGSGHFYLKSVNVAPRGNLGEPGRYEPRALHIGNGKCAVYHFHIYGQPVSPNTRICSPSRGPRSGYTSFGVYFGDGYNGPDYDVVVTSY